MSETQSIASDPSSPTAVMAKRLSDHEDSIRRYIRSRSGPYVLRETTVDDLYQETALIAVSRAECFVHGDEASFRSWCFTIARNMIRTSVKRQKRSVGTRRINGAGSTGPGIRESELGSPGRTPSSLVALGEHSVALLSAIEGLPEHFQEALILHRIEERPIQEVAKKLGRSRAATCRLIHRAIDAMRLTE